MNKDDKLSNGNSGKDVKKSSKRVKSENSNNSSNSVNPNKIKTKVEKEEDNCNIY